jgi:glucosamine-phosphate N-acetyltransferase
MNSFEYTTLLQLIQDNNTQTDEIIEQYILLLSQLTQTPMLSREIFMNNLYKITTMGIIYVCYHKTRENKISIVGSGTIIIEPKIIRSGKSVGHIEDIVVDEKCRSMGISKRIMETLFSFANENNCYKVILDCNPRLSDFYEKLGFEKHGIQMSKYF